MTRKILISPSYGAGWTSWNGSKPEVARYLLEYKPIIEFLEAGGKFSEDNVREWPERYLANLHPLLVQLRNEVKEKFGETIYVGGARDLVVRTVSGQVKIDEYDGYESVIERSSDDGWM